MHIEDPSSCIGRNVKDSYGRELGRCIGYNVDMAGNISSLGVETGSVFTEYPSDWVVSVKEDVVIMPEWKVDAKRFGLERGVFEKRVNALNEMLMKGEISQKVFDQMSGGLAAVRETHDSLSERLIRRLEELEEMDDRLNIFLAKVKLQGVSEEIGETAVKWTSDYCIAMKSMNESERVEIKDVLDLVSKNPITSSQARSAETEKKALPQAGSQDSPTSIGKLSSLSGN